MYRVHRKAALLSVRRGYCAGLSGGLRLKGRECFYTLGKAQGSDSIDTSLNGIWTGRSKSCILYGRLKDG